MLSNAYLRNREHLKPWEPIRAAEFFTERFQREDIERKLAAGATDESLPLALVGDREIVGRFNLAGVSRGPFQSAGLGYWIDRNHQGRGLASAAVHAIVTAAREELGLHRVEASTLVHNMSSQRVLMKNGFHKIGMAPRYLQIAGEWQDHNLYQVILHE
ncbi:hypothetical protein K8P10_002440 [Leucobacter sp. Psy1]|uniref:GNAT family N-acetyltransferase n=1 Tax=Leucobacter sp. Psy1 TaxID=2875729 RepID=UPI00351D21D0|nr:hypothetical protein K8P10_002440 [Leucobacter sp. Psy1]